MGGLCTFCKNGTKGLLSKERDYLEPLVSIETMMSCGCGGYITHSILRCKNCNKCYLFVAEEHWFSSENFYVNLLTKKETESAVKQIKKCKNLENRNCSCKIHIESENLSIGKKIWSEVVPNN